LKPGVRIPGIVLGGEAARLPYYGTMSATFYYVLHVLGIVLLTAYTFAAYANPHPSKRKGTMITTGVLSLIVLIGGFGLKAKVALAGWPIWLIAKIVIWVLLSGIAGVAFRREGLVGVLRLVTIVLVGTAIYLVYAKPVL